MAISFRIRRGLYIFSLSALASTASAQSTNLPIKFDEIYKLLRENMVGLTGPELDQAAVRGLLSEFRGRVGIATNNAAVKPTPDANLLLKATVYDKGFAYFRFGQVGAGGDEELARQFQQLATTNKIKGIVFDLRFADGEDYSAASALADKFLNSEQPLLDWGAGSAKSTAKSSPITVPVAVLVNRETRGAAEALAAVLRETKVGLLLGSTTAGQASIFKEFPLDNGQKLKIAISPVTVGKGKALKTEGLKPDIEIPVSLEEEKAYVEDPYRTISKPIIAVKMSLETNTVASAETNQPRSRLNEAELVRRHREGLSADEEFTEKGKEPASELRLIHDPVLNRALDLLKGLAVVQQTRPF